MHEKNHALSHILPGFFGKAGDHRDDRPYADSLGKIDQLTSSPQVETLVDNLLHSLGADFNSQENVAASGLLHHGQQVLVDAVGAGTTSPGKFFARCNHHFAEFHHATAVNGKHVMGEHEVAEGILRGQCTHIPQHAQGGAQPKTTPKEIVGGT